MTKLHAYLVRIYQARQYIYVCLWSGVHVISLAWILLFSPYFKV